MRATAIFVLSYRIDCGTPPKNANALHVPVAERFRRLGRVGHHEDRVGMRQVHRKEVDLALDAADHADGFAEVRLGMSWRMHQRHEHLLRPLAPARNVVLHDRDLAREAVLVAQPLENALGSCAAASSGDPCRPPGSHQ